ncbi:hypothetical protein EMCG_08509 [[Emmonsia] crescens]|uniref:Uncharacterized protein n=1 Tax=[Emmonsia] crescens TaxID=73230 RepID=A0A0G2I5C0_9EURO|nr:hypothetical protein EMCG_08509 [Emmonsia crescens UAMH 3008]
MRERERAKEREARRAAVAAVEKSMVETRAVYEIGDGGFGASSSAGGDGWAQVASRKRPAAGLLESAFGFGEVGVGVGNGRGILGGVRGGSGAAGGKSGTLVLRSGVGIGGKGKAVASGSGSGSEGGWRKFPVGFAEDVVDDWEEEVEREEREEREEGKERGPSNVSENGEAQSEEQDEEVGIANEIANRNGDEDRVPSPSIHPSIA